MTCARSSRVTGGPSQRVVMEATAVMRAILRTAAGRVGRLPEPQGASLQPAVEIEHLVKRYGGRAVVDEVTLRVEAGQIVALLGANGAGKTTTVECAVGFRRPDSGTVRVLGADPVR